MGCAFTQFLPKAEFLWELQSNLLSKKNNTIISSIQIEGHTWCSHECFECGKIIEAELKAHLKLAFQNHCCTDNYGDDLLLSGVKSIDNMVVDQVFKASPSSPIQVVDPEMIPKAKAVILEDVTKTKAKII